jgi:predicted TIM-barrel fold metal-dependent hydrolase
LRTAACLGVLFVIAACRSTGPRLTAEQEKIKEQLTHISPFDYALAKDSPVIDIHTHTFNARYLPLRGILLGKRDALPPVTWLISDPCAATLAHALIERTELAPAGDGQSAPRRESTTQAQEHRDHGIICGVLLHLLDKAAKKGAWDKTKTRKQQLGAIDETAKGMNLPERMMIVAAAHMMGMQEQVPLAGEKSDGVKGMAKEEKTDGLRGAVRFLWLLTQNDAELPDFFSSQYEGVPMRGRPLMVSHMMDLAPVYNQPAEGTELLDFKESQIKRMAGFQKRPGSNLIYFVAYNPYRDYWGTDGRALDVVRDAIEKQGAWGVKVYPPSGYRAAGNDIKPRPTGIRSRIAGQQWDARYGPLPGKSRAEKSRALDKNLRDFLHWCAENGVPVFVHAGTGEFEAQKGYGLHHSDPAFWAEFLKDNPNLRLCLGHAGGADYWFGGTKEASWGRQVYDLCRRYPNVYCEITTHAEMVSANRQAYFVDQLAGLFDDSKTDPDGKPYAFSFAKKLVYGTDWYLPDAADRDKVLLGTQRVFLHCKLRRHYKDYFFGNALSYLNARERLGAAGHSASVDKQLEEALTLVEETPCPERTP